jgi:hypothetical protein
MPGAGELVVSAYAGRLRDNVDDPDLALGNLAQSEACAYGSAHP